MVMWYTEYADATVVDIGIISRAGINHVFIVWQTGDGNGWFCPGHPSIGVISESR
jgi:hypothetical protein